jgi:hypothetical protein
MSVEYTISKSEPVAYVIADGKIEVSAGLDVVKTLIADKAFHPHVMVLVDLSGLDRSMSPAELGELASALGEFSDSFRNRIAIVLRKSLLYMARLACLSAQSSGVEMEAFSNIVTAKEWLAASFKQRDRRAA